MISAQVDRADIAKLRQQLAKLSLKRQQQVLTQILANASLPMRKAAKARAKQVVKPNKGFSFTRGYTTYDIKPKTIEKSIGVITLNKARVPAIDVGYRTKGVYNGWFAHFVDEGTATRATKKGAKRGQINSNNIMAAGEAGIPAAEIKIKSDIVKKIKQLAK